MEPERLREPDGPPRLATVIVNWNGGEHTRACLEHLDEHDCGPVIVVDNGSTDGSDEVAARWLESRDGELIRNPDNRGFAAAANQGMRRALDLDCEFVFLLNNDARLRSGAIEALVEAADRKPRAGMLAGKILDGAGERIWCAGIDIGLHANLQRMRGHGDVDRGDFDREEEVDALTGCGLLIRRQLLEEVGFFDEELFVYVEDVDLSLRAHEKGWSCLYLPGSVMTHDASSASGGGYNPWRKYMVAYNLVLFLKKRGRMGLWAAWVLVELLGWPLALGLATLRGRARAAGAKGAGMWHALLGRPAQPPTVDRA